MSRSQRFLVLSALAVWALVSSADAAVVTWSGNGTASWSDTSSWSGIDNPPASGDSLLFGAAGVAGTTLTDDLMTPGSYNIAGITFNSGAPAYVINPNTAGTNGFTLTGGISNSSTNTQTINDAISMTAARTFTMTAGGGNITLGGNIGGAGGGIATAGTGTLTLSGNLSLTGSLTANANGTIVLSGNNSGRAAGTTGLTTVNSGGILQLQANTLNTTSGTSYALSAEETANQPLTLNGGSTLQLRSDNSVVFAGGNNLGGLGSATVNIDVNQLTSAGTAQTLTFAPAGFNYAGTTINVSGGNGYALALGPLTWVSGSGLTLNPTTANLSVASIVNGGQTVTVGGSGSTTVTGAISGAGALTMSGSGVLTLSGNNTYTGTTTVSNGALTISGTTNVGSAVFNVGTTAGTVATLNVNTGALLTINGGGSNTNGGLNVGTVNNGVGIVNQTGGTASLPYGNGWNLELGEAAGGYGAMNISGGSLSVHEFEVGNSGYGLYNQTGGTVNVSAWFLLGRSNNNSFGVANFSGGQFIGTTSGLTLGASYYQKSLGGDLNISGSGLVNLGPNNLPVGVQTSGGREVVNLSGGTLQTNGVTSNGASTGSFNFNGGTLMPNAANTGFMSAPVAYVYPGGGTINNNNYNITIAQALLAPSGSGVSSIAVTGSGYTSPPLVYITGGGGSYATGLATINANGTLTGNITITNPGVGYSGSPTVTLYGGGGTYSVSGTTLAANTSGGMTFAGTGTTTLNGANTYTGGTTLNAGTLVAGNASALGTGSLTFNGGALAGGGSFTMTNPLVVNSVAGNRLYTNTINLTLSGSMTGSGTLAVAGATTGSSIILTGDTSQFTGTINLDTLNSKNNLFVVGSADNLANATLAFTDTAANTIYGFGYYGTGSATVQVGALSGQYGWIFNNVASTTATFQIGNLNASTTFGGVIANVTGTTALTTVGSGNLTLTGANTYTGGTTISAGTLTIGGAGELGGGSYAAAISNSGALVFNSTTSQEMSGIISGPGSLTQSGTGTLTVTGSNTYAGGTTVNAGTLMYDTGGSLGATGANISPFGSGPVTVNTGALLQLGHNVQTHNDTVFDVPNAVSINGSTVYEEDSIQHITGTLTVGASGGTLGSTYNAGSGDINKGLFLDGVLSGSGNLTLRQSGINTGNSYDTSMVYFTNNANTYAGTITVVPMSGTAGGSYLGLNGSNALSNATVNLTGNNTSSVQQFGTSPLVFNTGLGSAYVGALSGSGNVVLTGYNESTHAYGSDSIALVVGGNNTSTTYSGVISGGGSLTMAGSGVFTLAGSSTYTGGTSINNGAIQLGASNALPTGTVLTLNGGSLNLNGYSQSVAQFIINNSAFSQSNGVLTQTTNALNEVQIGGASGTVGSYTMTGGSLVAAGQIDVGNSGTGTMNLSGAAAITVNNGNDFLVGGNAGSNGTLTVGGNASISCHSLMVWAGTGSISVSGGTVSTTGVITIGQTAPGTYTQTGGLVTTPQFWTTYNGGGTSNLNGGTLSVGATGFAKGTGAATMYFNGGVLQAGGGWTLGGGNVTTTQIRNGGLIVNSNSQNLTISNVLAHSTVGGDLASDGGLIFTGGGMLTLSAANTFTGGTTVAAGTLQTTVGNGNAYGALGHSSGIVVQGGATLLAAGNDNSLVGTGASGTAPITVNAGGLLTSVSGVTDHLGGGLTLAGGTLGGPATATGDAFTYGTWSLDQNIAAGGNAATSVISAQDVYLGHTGGVTFTVNPGAANGIDLNVTGTFFRPGTFADTGLIKAGAGVMELSGTNSYTGGTTVAGGILQVANISALGAATGILTVNSGTLDLNNTSITTGNLSGAGGAITSNAAGAPILTVNNTSATVFAGAIADGAGGRPALVLGSGTLDLTGANTYNGGTTVSGGATLKVGNGGTLGGAGGTPLVLGSGSTAGTLVLGDTNGVAGTVTVSSLGTGGSSAASAVVGGNAGVSTLTVNYNGATPDIYGGLLGGSGTNQNNLALNKSGSGTLTLSRAYSYNGNTTVNAGVLSITGSLGNTAVSVASGASLTGVGGIIGGSVTLAAGGAIDFTKNGSLTTTTLALGGLTIGDSSATTSNLTFNISGSSTDLLNLGSGTLAVNPSGATINLNNLGVIPSGNNVYTLMSYGAQIGTGTFTIGSKPAGLYTFGIVDNPTSLQLTVGATPTPATAYWSGAYGASGGTTTWGGYNATGPVTNWSSDAAGMIDAGQVPGAISDVVFSGTASVSTALDAPFAVNSLTMSGTGNAVAITGTGNLTISGSASIAGGQGYTAGTGIVIGSAADPVTISVPTVTPQNDQSWANNSANLLTVSSNVTGNAVASATRTLTLSGSGSGGTTISGAIGDGGYGGRLAVVVNNSGGGQTILSGMNTYSGGTTVASGAFDVPATASLANGTVLAVGAAGAASLDYASPTLTAVTNSGSLSFTNTSGTVTLASLTGTGSTNFAANATITGAFSSGNATVAGNGVFGSIASGTLGLNGATANITTLSGGAINLGTTTLTANNGTDAGTIAGPGGGLVKAGGTSDVLTLSGTNSYGGGTTMNAGVLAINSSASLGASSSNLTIAGGTLQLGASVADTRNVVVASSANAVFNTNGFTLAVAGNITPASGAAGGLTKIGAGTLLLSGTDTYSGPTTISAGTLQLGSSAALPANTLTGGANLTGAGALDLGGNSITLSGIPNLTGTITSTSGVPTLTFNLGASATYAYGLSGSLGLAKSGAASLLTLTAAGTYTGGTTVNGGVVQITNDNQLGTVPTSPATNITLNGGGLYNNNSVVSLNANRTVYLGSGGGYFQAGWVDPFTINGQITGPGGLNVNWDDGTLILTNTGNNYQGGTTIGAQGLSYWTNASATPTLQLGATNALPYGANAGNLVFGTYNANAATLDLHGFSASINGLSSGAYGVVNNESGTGTYTLTLGYGDSTATFAGVIKDSTGTLALTKVGSGTQTLSGANTYLGATNVNNGVLNVTGSLTGSSITVGGGSFTEGSAGVVAGSGASFTVNGGSASLGGPNTYTGATNINAGILNLTGSLTGTAITVGGGAFNEGSTGVIAASSSFTVTSGSATLGGANTYTSDTVLSGGTLTLANSLALQDSALNYNNQGGTLNFGTLAAATVGGLKGAQSLPASSLTSLTINGGAGATGAYSGAINDGAGGLLLTKNGPGTQVLAGANSYTGGTVLTGGLLQLSAAATLGSTTAALTVTGGTLDLNGTSQSVGNLGGTSGTIVNNNSGSNVTLSVGANNANGAFSGVIADNTSGTGTVSLTKVGLGVETLGAPNTYSGPTVINGGTLRLTAASAPVAALAYTFSTGAAVNSGSLAASTTTTLGSTTPSFSATGGPEAGLGVMTLSGGANSYVDITGSGIPSLAGNSNNAYTIGVWIKTTQLGAAYLYYGDTGWNSGDETFYLNTGGEAAGTKTGGVQWGGGWVTGNTGANSGAWTFVSLVRSGGTTSVYVDGVADGTSTSMGNAVPANAHLRIGWSPSNDGSAPFVGSIGGAYVYNSALTAAQVQALMNVGPGNSLVGNLPSTTALQLTASGAAFDLNGINQTVASLAGVNSSNVYLGGATLTVNNSASTTFAGAISDSGGLSAATGGGLTMQGTGTLILNSSNTYSGVTSITAGTLQLGDGTVGHDGSIAGSGIVNNATLAYNLVGNQAYNGPISGSGSVTKNGGGVLTLGGANSYSGGTSLYGGTLVVSGSLASSNVAVAGGATLGGTGTIAGGVGVASGAATANQGNINLLDGTIGTLTLTSAGTALILGTGAGTSTLDFELGSTSTDQLALTAGSLVLNSSVGINLAQLTGGTIATGTYNLINFAGVSGPGGFFLQSTVGLPSNLVASLNPTANAEQLIIAPGMPATAYWSGAVGASWLSIGNWSAGSTGASPVYGVPGSSSDVYFTASGGGNLATTLDANFTVKSLNFTATSGAVTISGTNTLTIATAAGINDPAGAAAQTINANVALAAPQTWTVNSASPLAVGGVISGASTAGLTLAGSGTVILTAANTYSGGTTINSATLQLGDGLTANGSVAGNIADNGLVVFANPAAQTYPGTISGTGGVVASGSGVLTFNTAHTYAGGTTVNANATLQLGDGLNLGSVTGNISDNGLVNFNNPLTQAMTGTISGNGGVTKTAAGLLTLAAANSYAGGTTVSGGTLSVGVANALPSTGAVTINGGQLNLNGQGPSSVGAVTLASGSIAGQSGDSLVGSSFNVQSGAVSVVLAGPTAGLTKTGDGTAVLSAANTYAGGTTVSGGQLQYGAANALPTTGAVLVNGGQLDLNGQGSNSVGDVTLQSGSITGQSGDTLVARSVNVQSGTVSANLGGGASLVKSGPGTVVLSGNNSYAGGTSVGGGVLAISGSSNLGPGNLTLGAGTLQTTGQYTLDASTVTLTDATAGIDTPNSADVTLTGLITGGGGLNKTGPGTLELAGAAGNNYVGDTSVQAGTLIADTDSALSPTSTLVIGDGASVILNFGGGAGTDSMPAFAGVPAFATPTLATPALSPAGISTVPEPGTLALLLVGAMSLVLWKRRSR